MGRTPSMAAITPSATNFFPLKTRRRITLISTESIISPHKTFSNPKLYSIFHSFSPRVKFSQSTTTSAANFNDFVLESDSNNEILLPSVDEPKQAIKFVFRILVWTSVSLVLTTTFGGDSARAASDDSIRASSFGLKVASFLRGSGWSDEVIVFALATLPLVELRGAIPVGYWLQLKPVLLTVLSVLGNMVPVPIILLYLKKFAKYLAKSSPTASQYLELFFKKINHMKHGRPVKVLEDSSEVPSISIESKLDNERGQANDVTQISSVVDGSSSQVASSRSRSRFSFFPGNISFRLSRAASLGSSRAYSFVPNGFTGSSTEEGVSVQTDSTISSINRNEVHHDTQLLHECSISRLHAAQVDRVLQVDSSIPRIPLHLQDVESISARDMTRNNENTGSGVNGNLLRNITGVESMETRRLDRRIRSREPVERSVRFSRTLSVGRLRDRVLRRSFSDALSGRLQEDRVVRDSSQDNGGQAWAGITRPLGSNETTATTQASYSYPPSQLNSIYNNQDFDVDASRTREARYHEIMERRTDFLERRRRLDLRSAHFRGWVAALRTCLGMKGHVYCLANIELVVAHAERLTGPAPIQMMTQGPELAYLE